jgi:hypothetical protein
MLIILGIVVFLHLNKSHNKMFHVNIIKMENHSLLKKCICGVALMVLLVNTFGITKVTAQNNVPTGAINGLFSVGESSQVYFSRGNLQYQASTNTWRFAENQWDIIADDNALITQTFDRWIDLFSWGTSGYNHGAVCYQPWILEMGGQYNHAAYGCDTCGLRDHSGKADWGYNAIVNGGSQEHFWNTLTLQEWQYVMTTRNTSSGMRYVKAVVNNVNGIIVFPDNWDPNLVILNNVNNSSVNYNTNTISAQDWLNVFETHGAVFLPAAGRFHGEGGLMDVGSKGAYWSSTSCLSYLKYLACFSGTNVDMESFYPHCRYSVRLVHFTNGATTYSINTISNPIEGGTVSGGGSYHYGESCTLTANANSGYTFTNWMEGGTPVSTNASYTFNVTGNRTLVANFTETTNVDFIVFADAAVKAVCVEHWDANDDGELSYAEAAAVTVLDDAFMGNSEISTFDELRYFVGLTYISFGDFHGSSIASLTVPENITQIHNQAFYGCQQLSSINIPEGVTSLGYGVFQYCRALPEITLPSSLVELGPVVFLNCNSLRSITLFSETPPNLDGSAFDEVDKTLITVYVPCGSLEAYQNAEGWNEFTNIVEMCDMLPTGAINGKFTINANGDQVYFSQGNLQYQASTNTWRFAENQWDYVGNDTYGTVYEGNVKSNNCLLSSTYAGWIDLFGWGTSGYNHGAVCYQPWSSSENNSDYYAYGSSTFNLNDQTGQADWGYNAISNGGNQKNMWRSLTNGEWRFLLNDRNTPSGVLFAKATVNNLCGILILPDNWDVSIYNLIDVNSESAPYSSNIITLSDWQDNMQNVGVVFLPACWSRMGKEMNMERFSWGQYWTTTHIGSSQAYPVSFSNDHLDPCSINGYDNRRNGQAVRLVRTATMATSCSIEAVPNPTEGGTVTGTGTYGDGTICTLIATANESYTFVNWTENGNQVSLETSYSFTVNGDRTLVANFVSDDPNTYNITAMANPSAGGTVTGSGSYDEGTTCTLTATANTGYVFNNWTKNGTEVSSSATYSFTVTEAGDYVANFEVQGEITNHWTPVPEGLYSQSTTIKGVILFNGVEQFSNQLELGIFCGDECRGSAIASEFFITHRFIADVNVYGENGHQLSFRLYDHSQGMELNYTPPANVVFTEDGYGEWMDPLALNFSSLVEISATVDPEDAGVVAGEGNYAIGASCTLTATANEGYQFAYWTLNDVEVSTNPTISFTVAEAASYVAHFQYVHNRSLVEGWNWWSTFIEQEGINGLEMLENSLGASGIRIQGKNASVDRIEYEGNVYWYGSLNSINNEQMYKIRTNSVCSATVVGDAADLDDHPITINSGWNWIGFPSSQSLSVETAMSGFSPETNDVIKGRGGSTTYLSTGEYNLWYGTLTTLEPGQGYMYKSNSSSSKTLTFQSGRSGEAKAVAESSLFEPMVDNYANNMLITAVVEINDEELRSDDFELAAFVGNECRGSVRLMYVEPLDRYVAFLLVFGDTEEPIGFVLSDGQTECYSQESTTYTSDGLVGSLTDPTTLHFGTLGTNDQQLQHVSVYPNPSNDVFNIEGSGIRRIEVANVYGQVVVAKEMKGDRMQINLNDCANGTYLLRIVTNNEIVTSKLIKY